MQIERLESFFIGGGYVLRITTDNGLTGLGQTACWGYPEAVGQIVNAFERYLIGQDPMRIEHHWQHLYRMSPFRGTALSGAISAVDMALWDIIGKAANLPLYKLWGGEKEKIIPYASMVALSTPEERAEQASSLQEEGWQAMKIRLHNESISDDIKIIEAVRDAVGQDFTIMVDANQAQSSGTWQPGVMWNFKRAYETAVELQDLDVYWLEEPLKRYDFEGLAELNAKVEMRIAGGENNPGLHEFVQMCEMDTYKLLQPESMVMNGMTNLRKIGNLAELHGKEIVPHHGGGNIGVIAHQHLVASWRHAPFMELLHDPPIGHYKNKFSIMVNAPEVDSQGFMPLPTEPGIGIEIDPDLIINN